MASDAKFWGSEDRPLLLLLLLLLPDSDGDGALVVPSSGDSRRAAMLPISLAADWERR